jgi:RNA-splicing ligase RtcB
MEELQRVELAEDAGGARTDIDQVVAATEAAGMSRRVALLISISTIKW